MFPGLNPKRMQAVMKQMGIQQQEISANKVIIEKNDGNITINNPSVIKINMQGQTNFQISGDVSEGESEDVPKIDDIEEDIKTIMEKVGCLEQEARMAYEKADNDLAEAILSLS
jgi:nascent polypeptide-associated complex subunit alpha